MLLNRSFLLFSVSFFLINCSSHPTKTELEVNQEVQKQSPVELHGGVAQRGFEAFLSAKNLSDIQKRQLLELHSQLAHQTFQIQDETSKLKVVLFETLATKPYNKEKVQVLKKKLIALNDSKMRNMLEALDQVQGILGE